jgi:hypothetical protein
MPAQKLDRHSLKILNMEPTNIVSNNSHQELMSGGDECDSLKEVPSLTSIADGAGRTGRRGYGVSVGEWLTIIILCYVNLINYMDRFTIAGKNFYFSCWLNIGYDLFRSRVAYYSDGACVGGLFCVPNWKPTQGYAMM